MSDIRPPIQAALDAFGLPATVTPPGETAIQTVAIWLPPVPYGPDFHPADRKRFIALPREQLLEVPSGTVVTVAEEAGGELVDWTVNEVERVDRDHYRVIVVPA